MSYGTHRRVVEAATAMDGGSGDRPPLHSHRSASGGGGGGGGELFICFTSRLSYSSSSTLMRVPSSSSKPLTSPGRGGAAPSLSASVSRRLKSSGSVKGGQSPMFPAVGGRKKGCAFEAAEPSSPKVTCIGQVRVKSKKKKGTPVGKAVARSRSQRSAGEASFRRSGEVVGGERECFPGNSSHHGHGHGWVHQLPVTICEALRALGSEINCFLPCGGRSFCSSSARDGEEEKSGGGGVGAEGGEKSSTSTSSSCGAVFARWLMAIQESEEGKRGGVVGVVVEDRKRRDVGLLVGGRERSGAEVLEELERSEAVVEKEEEEVVVVVEEEKAKEEEVEEQEEEGRVSVCIPPKNALLLMRCRSDPVRMAALATRFCGYPAAANVQVEEPEDGEEACEDRDEAAQRYALKEYGKDEELLEDGDFGEDEEAKTGQTEADEIEAEKPSVVAPDHVCEITRPSEGNVVAEEQQLAAISEVEGKQEEAATESSELLGKQVKVAPAAAAAVEETQLQDVTHFPEREEVKGEVEIKARRSGPSTPKGKEGRIRRSSSSKEKEKRRHSFSSEKDARRHSFSTERDARRASFSVDRDGRRWSFTIEKENLRPVEKEEKHKKKRAAKVEKEEEIVVQMAPESIEESPLPEQEEREEEQEQIEETPAEKRSEEHGGGKSGAARELPDCLLMMMYEPKLSMEVSKETWVCSTDFLHWRHYQHHPSKVPKGGGGGEENNGGHNKPAAEVSAGRQIPTSPALPPPPPAAAPRAAEKKVVFSQAGAAPYGPFVLTRCKSEPMRTSARLAPEACFWKNRHQPISAAGIGC